MNTEKELISQIKEHLPKMENVFEHIVLSDNIPKFKEIYELSHSYLVDSRHFFKKKMYVQSFEALMISWAYIDVGLKLGIFELIDDDLKTYFTIEDY